VGLRLGLHAGVQLVRLRAARRPLSPARRVVAIITLLLFVALFMPVPLRIESL